MAGIPGAGLPAVRVRVDAAVAGRLGQLAGVGGISGVAGLAGGLLLVDVLAHGRGQRDGGLHRLVDGAVRRHGDGDVVFREGLADHQVWNRRSKILDF